MFKNKKLDKIIQVAVPSFFGILALVLAGIAVKESVLFSRSRPDSSFFSSAMSEYPSYVGSEISKDSSISKILSSSVATSASSASSASFSSNLIQSTSGSQYETSSISQQEPSISTWSKDIRITGNVAISVDFSSKDFSNTAFLKKFDLFNCTWPWQKGSGLNDQALAIIPSLSSLKAESIRTDLFMGYGGIGREIAASPTLNGITSAEYAMVEKLTKEWKKNGIRGNLAYFANTVYTGGGAAGDKWRNPPDLIKWNTLCHNIANYFKQNDLGVMTHEIWNEPDFCVTDTTVDGIFFRGDWQDYIDTYLAGSTGIRAADKDAIVGGISAAWINRLKNNGGYAAFLKQVKEAEAPLDFVSWHYYGKTGRYAGLPTVSANLSNYIYAARSELEKDDYFSTVQQHLNEFNVTIEGSFYKSYGMVEAVLNVYQRLLSATDITRVSWAAPLEEIESPVLSLIDRETYERFPSFRTMWMYARLPVGRVETSVVAQGVKILAASDKGRAAAIIYDSDNTEKEIEISFNGIGFDNYSVSVYSIDSNDPVSDPTSDAPKKIHEYLNQSIQDADYRIKIPKEGAVYIEINKSNQISDLDFNSKYSSRIVRKDYWYPQRGDNFAFADFHLNSISAVVGSGSAKDDLGAACSITLESMKDEKLNVDFEVIDSPIKRSPESMLGVKIDFETGDNYTKSVFFYINDINGKTTIPLGTLSAPNQEVSMGNGKGSFALDLNKYAPAGWNGRIQICSVVNDVGKDCGATFNFR